MNSHQRRKARRRVDRHLDRVVRDPSVATYPLWQKMEDPGQFTCEKIRAAYQKALTGRDGRPWG